MSIRKEIHNTLNSLQEGKTILYPTDTVWGIGCDATNEIAVDKVFLIKKRAESKSMIILVDSINMLQSIISNIPNSIIDIVKNTKTPTSYIFHNPNGLAKNVVANDNTVAIRIVNDVFCQKLIHSFGKPIVSTSANLSNDTTPKSFSEIQTDIIKNVDYTVDLHQEKQNSKSSSIIKIHTNGTIEVLRKKIYEKKKNIYRCFRASDF